jgi:hypothetical protein
MMEKVEKLLSSGNDLHGAVGCKCGDCEACEEGQPVAPNYLLCSY